MKKIFFAASLLMSFAAASGQELQFALLKYRGGGDWYANPTSLTNLARYCNEKLHMQINPDYATVDVGSAEIFNYPFLHITGHGNIIFSPEEAENLRNYLTGGGFLEISDNYGIDPYIRKAMKQVFPDLDFMELPFSHDIYHQAFEFPQGLPKIHEHDGKPPQGFGIIYQGRLVCFYDYECDLGDGWEDPEVHHDPPELHEKALQMGANIVQYAFTH